MKQKAPALAHILARASRIYTFCALNCALLCVCFRTAAFVFVYFADTLSADTIDAIVSTLHLETDFLIIASQVR